MEKLQTAIDDCVDKVQAALTKLLGDASKDFDAMTDHGRSEDVSDDEGGRRAFLSAVMGVRGS